MSNKKINLISILTLATLMLVSCENKSSPKDLSINAVSSRDSLLIQQYHEKCLNLRGINHFFIPKDELNSILKVCCTDSVSVKDAKNGDLVMFFDSIGNVVYQAKIHKVEFDKLIVECLDLKTFKYYTTLLEVDSIHDLNKDKNLSFMIFR